MTSENWELIILFNGNTMKEIAQPLGLYYATMSWTIERIEQQ